MIRALCIDIAGVLTEDDRALPGAVNAFAALQASGLPLRLLTNTSRTPAARVRDKYARPGSSCTTSRCSPRRWRWRSCCASAACARS